MTPDMIPSSYCVQSIALVKLPELGMGMSTHQVKGELGNAISLNWLGWGLLD